MVYTEKENVEETIPKGHENEEQIRVRVNA
jgi:hypothetical protein